MPKQTSGEEPNGPSPTKIVPALVPLGEAAQMLGISRNGAYGLIERGQFPLSVRRVGSLYKVNRAELEAYIAGETPADATG